MANDTLADQHRRKYERLAVGRRFVLKALGLSAAGLVAGGGAAWASGKLENAATMGATVSDLQSRLEALTGAHSTLELSAQGLQLQVADLQSQLAFASSQNAQLAADLSSAQARSTELEAQFLTTQSQLDAANAQLARSKELIALFDQLEGVGLDGAAQSGLAAVAGGLSAAAGHAPTLRQGVALARSLLDDFELTLPGFQTTLNWLGEQIVNLKVTLTAIELSAQDTLNATIAGAAAAFGGLVSFVLDHLPFNIGQNVKTTLANTQSLLSGLPAVIAGAEDKFLVGLGQRVGEGQKGWRQSLVKPVREQTLAPADQLLAAVEEANAQFAASLNDPVQMALARRAALRQSIAAFRAANNL
jgi:hypothetical protein